MKEQNSDDYDRFAQLDDEVKDMLRRLEPDNVKTLMYVSRIPLEELRGLMKFMRDFQANKRFVQMVLLTMLAVAAATAAFGENIMKIISWFGKGGNP